MINRILIRIKVVQILYSYLLSRNEFEILQGMPGSGRDREFAYAVYLDMLRLIVDLSGIRMPGSTKTYSVNENKYLRNNRVGGFLASNSQFKKSLTATDTHFDVIAPTIQSLQEKIINSVAFQDYSRKRVKTLETDVKMWAVELDTIIRNDKDLQNALRELPDFSLSGYNRGIQEAIDTIRSYNDTQAAYLKAKSDLKTSLDKAYELYYALFALILDIVHEQDVRIETAKNKYLAKNQDLNPDLRLVDNDFIRELTDNEKIIEYRKNPSFSWLGEGSLVAKLLDAILASDLYSDFMAKPEYSRADVIEFWRSAMKNIILPNEELLEAMESKSIYWNDDINIIGTFVLKTLRRFANEPEAEVLSFLPQYKDEEDAEFGEKLLAFAVENKDEYRGYIDSYISRGWDPDRLAFMDIVIMLAAIAEIVNFNNIPIPVSLNEYIEIANNYSTQRSGQFINGLLYSVVSRLVNDGKVKKPFTVQD